MTSLHISSDLTWTDHYSAIISKAYKLLYFIHCSTSNSHSFIPSSLYTRVSKVLYTALKSGILTE